MLTRSRVRGTFLGIAIGDAAGMPVETFQHDKIAELYGRITEYHVPENHKWFKGEPAGMTTDDTELSLAVAEGMIEKPLDMDAQVKFHVVSLKEGNTKGWGRSTKDSIRRLANGVSWTKSGEPGGGGNGVAMKIAPVGLYMAMQANIQESGDFIMRLSQMTHGTSIAASSGLAVAFAVATCAGIDPDDFNAKKFTEIVTRASRVGEVVLPETLEDNLTERLALLENYEEYDTQRMIEEFGRGSCYCYNSIPFSLMHFMQNPTSLDSLYDVITAGGDTDTNGSMVGALLGALNGQEFWPEHLVNGLDQDTFCRLLDVADRFYDKFK
jgi:ADP-ribosyl-[dinitrogen reductase] hydrolase